MMKRLLLTFLLTLSALVSINAAVYTVDDLPVAASGRKKFVCNPDHILADSTERKLCNLLQALEDSTTIQVLVVAVEDIDPEDVVRFSIDLGRKYGVGQKDKDNGLVVLLSTGMRKIRFSTGGGLEGDLPDAICKRIQYKYMTPAFKNDEWDRGMMDGMIAVCQVLGGDTEFTSYLEQDSSETDEDDAEFDLETAIGIVIVLLIICSPIFALLLLGYILFWFLSRHRKRCPNCKEQMEVIGSELIDGKKVNILRCPHCGIKKKVDVDKSSGYWLWVSSVGGSSDSDSDSDSDSGSDWGGGDFDGGGADSDF